MSSRLKTAYNPVPQAKPTRNLFRRMALFGGAVLLSSIVGCSAPKKDSFIRWDEPPRKEEEKKDQTIQKTNDDLYFAIHSGNIDAVKLLLSENIDVNKKMPELGGRTLLMEACSAGNLDIATLLIHNGADVKIKDAWYGDALYFSLPTCNRALIKLLIINGADVNAKYETQIMSFDGSPGVDTATSYDTPLNYAARYGYLESLQALIENGATVDSTDGLGRTPLMDAARTCSGHTPEDSLSKKKYTDILRFLLISGADINAKDHDGNSSLGHVIIHGDMNTASFLIKNGADVNSKNSNGRTPLMLVISSYYKDEYRFLSGKGISLQMNPELLDVVKFLIENGADINARDNEGNTLLIYAMIFKKPEIVMLLLENGADLNLGTPEGLTPLLIALQTRTFDIAKFLLERNAYTETTDTMGATPLIRMVSIGYLELVKLLVEHNANVNARTNEGATALDYAIRDCNLQTVRFLIQSGADVNSKTTAGQTALMQAVSNHSLDKAKLLIENGADIHAVDTTGTNALMHAIQTDGVAEVSLLIENKADLNSVRFDGASPLFVAIIADNLDIIKLLVENGADLNYQTAGYTPLKYALEFGSPQVVNFLKQSGAKE